MLALSQSRWLRYFSFSALYFAQGIPWGFISTGYVVFLADQGLGNEEIGKAIGAAYLPWSFKILWGPLIDRFPTRFGRRRPYIILAELLMGMSLLALLVPDPTSELRLVATILFVHNTFAAMQDVAVDALAVDILPEDERGTANSIMWAAKALGVAAGGGGGTVIAKHTGWPTLFVLMTAVVWLVMLIPVLVRERPKHAAGNGIEPSARFSPRELWRSFAFKPAILGLAIAFFTPIGYAMAGPSFTRLIRKDLGFSEELIGMLAGVVDPIASVAGALIGGILADRLGKKRVIGGFMVLIAASMAGFGLLQSHWGVPLVVAYAVVSNVVINAYNAATFGFFMSLSNPAIGATQFAVFMATTNLCYSQATRWGGWVADHHGYPAMFYAAAAVQLVTIVLLPFCDEKQAEVRFRQRDLAGVPGA